MKVELCKRPTRIYPLSSIHTRQAPTHSLSLERFRKNVSSQNTAKSFLCLLVDLVGLVAMGNLGEVARKLLEVLLRLVYFCGVVQLEVGYHGP